jgi:ParB family chromosome partitioning protein
LKINISEIKVNDRIRKDFGDIKELASDIDENGLINPILVTPDYTLIAGERRLRAHEFLGHSEIEVNVMPIRDAEHQLKLEIAENEQRKEFTFSERIEWARKLERIERVKAEERKKAGVSIDLGQHVAEGGKGKTLEIVAEQTGFGSGENLRRAQYIADNASQEVIDQLNQELISINKAYNELKEQNKDLFVSNRYNGTKHAELKEKVSELNKEIENLKSLADHLHNQYENEKNKPAQVIKETVEVQKIPDDYKEVKRKLQEKEDELLALTKAQIVMKDKFIIHDTFSGLAQSVGKHMKKLELEIVKYPGDPDVARNILSTIKILDESIKIMRTWTDVPKGSVIIDGQFIDV